MGKKLLYFIGFLHTPGGMERVLTLKVNYLVQELGYQVGVVVLTSPKKVYFELDDRVELFYLGMDNFEDYGTNSIQKLIFQQYYTPKHFEAVKRIINQYNPDICISFLGPEFYFLPKIGDKSKKIVEFHNSKESHLIEAAQGKLGSLKTFHKKIVLSKVKQVANQYNKSILLSSQDQKSWGFSNSEVIPNPLTFEPLYERENNYEQKGVIAVGRVSYQKGFDLLIEAWEEVNKQYPDWQLTILGRREGTSDNLDEIIKNKGLEEKIQVLSAKNDVISEYYKNSIFVLSSRYEGFGMVLVEAASCGLPLVSFDCPSGPSEIIINGETGFLANYLDTKDLAVKIVKLIKDKDLRSRMGKKAQQDMRKYSMPTVMNRWNQLFKTI